MFHNLVFLLVRKHNDEIELVCTKNLSCAHKFLVGPDVDIVSLICSSALASQILQFLNCFEINIALL